MNSPDTLTSSLPTNPLPPCPETPNCVRISKAFEVQLDRLYRATQQALVELGPVELRLHLDKRRAAAVYRVVLAFKDDVKVALEPHPSSKSESVLHVRSASRCGNNDLGVNQRRIDRLLRAIRRQLRVRGK